MINHMQLRSLLETQIETNHAYYGDAWTTVWKRNSIRNSIYREFAEFLDEVEAAWHCYKPNPKFDQVAAVYELVDIIHFMLCNTLTVHNIKSKDDLRRLVYQIPKSDPFEEAVFSSPEQNGVSFTEVEGAFTEYMYYNGDLEETAKFLDKACRFLGIDIDTYLKAHMRKNSRNRLRAASGVLEGKYDKSKEVPLTLEF
ncbi:nucleoside triphosphate pyrophosphohydrolase [Serratia phage vB_SmaA_3M]|uniref:Putative dUTP diphosphatase n=1 Tax=Serratia phage vB_SmaA_3M TaxID=2419930 RepID=A0A3G2YSB9_9CAUD|nr:nucleoside triphosphate pyrophosphohydrolase [Serratia phage vB_SmaA_3M]AYP28414.1 putative dUTP diphosphatase [Serratia phage vB_SmaA_3M]